MKKQFILFLLILIPFSFSLNTLKEVHKQKKFIPSTKKEEIWHTAQASYYDSKDEDQTGDTTGIGASGRIIKSGSIAFGSIYTEKILKRNKVIYIKVKDMNVMTPYGKGVFRVDDLMADEYNKKGHYYIDFYHEDLSERLKEKGRFKVKFKIIENG